MGPLGNNSELKFWYISWWGRLIWNKMNRKCIQEVTNHYDFNLHFFLADTPEHVKALRQPGDSLIPGRRELCSLRLGVCKLIPVEAGGDWASLTLTRLILSPLLLRNWILLNFVCCHDVHGRAQMSSLTHWVIPLFLLFTLSFPRGPWTLIRDCFYFLWGFWLRRDLISGQFDLYVYISRLCIWNWLKNSLQLGQQYPERH